MNNKIRTERTFRGIAPYELQMVETKSDGNEIVVSISLEESLKVRNHSPTGFNWGYHGSGPAQTALAILLKAANKLEAETYYQDFKCDFIAGVPDQTYSFFIKESAIHRWLELKRKGKTFNPKEHIHKGETGLIEKEK